MRNYNLDNSYLNNDLYFNLQSIVIPYCIIIVDYNIIYICLLTTNIPNKYLYTNIVYMYFHIYVYIY